MRRSFELAFATAYLFGGDKPRFLEVDDISFDKPVDVGDLLVFKVRESARVLLRAFRVGQSTNTNLLEFA